MLTGGMLPQPVPYFTGKKRLREMEGLFQGLRTDVAGGGSRATQALIPLSQERQM